MFAAFSEELMKRSENLCIRKTNLKSNTSSVHVGNNVWEVKPDQLVMPIVMSNVAQTMSETISQYNLDVDEMMETFLEDVLCEGEHNTSNKKEIEQMRRMVKLSTSALKHIVFNKTKQNAR